MNEHDVIDLKELKINAKKLADNLEDFSGRRLCNICGCQPEIQAEMIEYTVRQGKLELIENIEEAMFCAEIDKKTLSNIVMKNHLKMLKARIKND